MSDVTRRVKHNPKYSNVVSRLDTGPNMRKILKEYEGTAGPNARGKQRNEFFSTLKPLTLAKLLEPCIQDEESIYKIDADEVASMASAVSSVVLKDEVGSQAGDTVGGNLLIYDMRSFEEFDKDHIYGSRHFDRTMLSKSTNNFPREIYFFKGSADSDKMVLLYDGDGKGLTDVANRFVELGVENTYVLAGGYQGVLVRCPHILSNPPEGDMMPTATLAAGLRNTSKRDADGCSTAASTRTQQTTLSTGSRASAASKPWR